VLFLDQFPRNWPEKSEEEKLSRQDNEQNPNNLIPTFTREKADINLRMTFSCIDMYSVSSYN
jgi:hypothetical protein